MLTITNNHQNLSLNHCTKQDIFNYFHSAWITEDTLFSSIVNPETFYLNPDSLRNPLIFYYGHSAVFYINKLILVNLLHQGINPPYETLYEMGVDPKNSKELQSAIAQTVWHKVEEIKKYRHQAYETITEIIEKTPLELPITPDSRWWAIIMGIEHQRIHIETSSMLIRQLEVELVKKPSSWHYGKWTGKKIINEMITVEGGEVIFERKEKDNSFGWDIDFGYKQVTVKPFTVSKYLITNGEYLEFVEEKGYENPKYWSKSAWQWKEENNITHPKFWQPQENHYHYRLMFDQVKLPLDLPVEVNHYEAKAYCHYISEKKGRSHQLLTEAQWRLLAQTDKKRENEYNLNFQYFSPRGVNNLTTSHKQEISDIRGNLWQWLEEILAPLSGFNTNYLYPEYSAPFFDNNHYMLAGGSWASSGYSATIYYRNWFRPYFYQHAGFRLVNNW